MPKKMVRAATRMAILSKFQDQEDDHYRRSEPDRSEDEANCRTLLKALKISDKTCLIGTPGYDDNDLSVGAQHRRHESAAGVAVQCLHGAAAEAARADQGGARRLREAADANGRGVEVDVS